MVNICRLCLGNVLDSISIYNDSTSHETKIKFLIPKIDLSITPNFELCCLCTHLLCAAYSFMQGCIQTENVIKEYISQNGMSMLSLENVKRFRKSKVLQIGNDEVDDSNVKVEIHDEDIKINVETVNTQEVQNSSSTCNRCYPISKTEDSIETHQKECISKCNESREVCSTEEDLESHFKIHAKRLHTCQICKQSFKEFSDLKHHIFKKHNTKSIVHVNFKPLTYKSLRSKGSSDISSKTLHSRPLHKLHNCKNQEYRCNICNQVFKLRWVLNKHIINYHQKPFVCEICGLRCSANSVLIEHMRVHTGERPFKCESCGKAFAQRSSLTTHIRCLHENIKPFVCEVCGKTFAVHGSLTKHMRVHTDPVEKTFSCSHEGCNKMFNTQRAVVKHIQRHTAIKRHKCTLCDKTFLDTPALKRHMRTHTGEKPYVCHICEKAFSQAYNLKIHFKSHRPKEKRSKIPKKAD